MWLEDCVKQTGTWSGVTHLGRFLCDSRFQDRVVFKHTFLNVEHVDLCFLDEAIERHSEDNIYQLKSVERNTTRAL